MTPQPNDRDREVSGKILVSHHNIDAIIASYRAEIESAKDKEIGNFQNEVRDFLIKQTGCSDDLIDGASSDSGWEDFTLCEISQGISYLKERLTALQDALRKAENKRDSLVFVSVAPANRASSATEIY